MNIRRKQQWAHPTVYSGLKKARES